MKLFAAADFLKELGENETDERRRYFYLEILTCSNPQYSDAEVGYNARQMFATLTVAAFIRKFGEVRKEN